MSVVRRGAIAADNFVTISNAFVRDGSLSLKARALGIWLMSHRDGWQLSVDTIAKTIGEKDGETAVKSGLRELEAAGYLVREQSREGTQFGAMDYVISDVSAGHAEGGFSADGEPVKREIAPHKKNIPKKTNLKRDSGSAASEEAGEDGALPLPGLPVPAKPEKPVPKVPSPTQAVVAAYVDGYREQTGADPVKSLIGKVSGQAKRLIDDGADQDALREAAEAMGRTQWTDLATQLTRTLAARKAAAPSRPSVDSVNDWLKDCWQRADVTKIRDRAGISWHVPDIPGKDALPTADDVREFTFQNRRQWIADNRTKIIEAIARREGLS